MPARQKRAFVIPTRRKIMKTLRETFGFNELRETQDQVIQSVLRRENTLAIMPTGAGKSLCYQLPALLMPGTTLIVSPLISLMKDQRDKMADLELSALELNSTYAESEQSQTLKTVLKGKAEFLYVTPERLSDREFLDSIRNLHIDLMVIDEAHCISQWGHDFRPAYMQIGAAWRELGKPPLLALTATATEEALIDIQQQLGLEQLNVFQAGVLRANLNLEAFYLEDELAKTEKLLQLLPSLEGTGIIYASTVKAVDELHALLKARGVNVAKYHGRMKTEERHETQENFMRGDVPLIVATNAFGMGIDKSNIRYVLHFNFPGSLESYYQEFGRAGRDGQPARCILLYLKRDKRTQSFFLAGRYPNASDITKTYDRLRKLDPEQVVSLEDFANDIEGVSKSKAKVVLSVFRDKKMIRTSRHGGVVWRGGDLTPAMVETFLDNYRRKEESDQNKLKQMIVYAQTAMCRWKILLRYFGQKVDWACCGHCDNCRKGASHLVEKTASPLAHVPAASVLAPTVTSEVEAVL